MVTVGFQHSPREKIFDAVIDAVDVKRVSELSPRDVEHDNPEFRRVEETVHFLEQIYGREVSTDDLVTIVRFSAILERPSEISRPHAARSTLPELGETRFTERVSRLRLALSLLECQTRIRKRFNGGSS